MFNRLTPLEGISALNDRLVLEASILSSDPNHAPDKAFRPSRRIRSALSHAADLHMITDQSVIVPSGYELRGGPSQFFLMRSKS